MSSSAPYGASDQRINDNSLLAPLLNTPRGGVRSFGSLIKVEHTIFSAPFVLMGALIGYGGVPPWDTLALISVALFSARGAAMAFNRIVDLKYDCLNPRTALREMVTGEVSQSKAIVFTTICAIVFVISAALLNTVCGVLSIPTLALILGYSYFKRFSMTAHFALGLSLGISPGAAWLAVGAEIQFIPILLGLIVVFWVAGFDILYSLADIEFDRANKLHSIPARLGASRSIWLARTFHLVTLILMCLLYPALQLPGWAVVFLLPVGVLFFCQHTLVTPHDLSRLNAAFFTTNGWIGFLFAVLTLTVYFWL